MKKLTAWALLLAMCVAMFAGCSTEKPNNTTANVPETTVGATAEDYLGDAKAYLRTMYLSKAGKVLRDFDLVSSVQIDGFVYDIQWTANDAENVAISDAAVICQHRSYILFDQNQMVEERNIPVRWDLGNPQFCFNHLFLPCRIFVALLLLL